MQRSTLSPSDEIKLIKLLVPKDIDNLSRFGVQGDGGYVIPSNFKFSNHICLGVGDDVSFENDLRMNIEGKIICVDHTVKSLPKSAHSTFEHLKIKIENKTNVENIISDLKHNNDMSLKCDVEGWEYPLLLDSDENFLNKFDLIVIEFHCIGNNGDNRAGDQGPIKNAKLKLECLAKISETHHLIHVSNCRHVPPLMTSIGVMIPYVAELTFIKRHKFQCSATKRTFPTILDFNSTENCAKALSFINVLSKISND